MASKPSDFPVFTELSESEIQARIEKLADCLGNIPDMLNLPDLQVDAKCIAQIIDKVEKRRIYFHIFHNGMEMGELHQSVQNNELNAKIAIKLLINVIRKVADNEKKTLSISIETIQTIYYAFRYRDLSKEAVMVISKSLVG
jgi:hypothetical protein